MATWNNVNSGLWSDSANWSGGVPNAIGAQADFVAVGGSGASIATFTENTTTTLGTLNITSTGARDVLFQGSLADSGSGIATLSFNGPQATDGTARVNITTAVGGGEFEISGFGGLRVQLANETEFNVSTAGTTARINAQIIGSGGLTKLGAGTLQLGNSTSTFTGHVSIEGGTLYALNGGALGHGIIDVSNNAILRASGTVTSSVGTVDGATGTAGNGQIMAVAGTTLTLAGNFGHTSNGILTLGNAVDNGTIAFAITAAAWGGGAFRFAGGTIRIDNAFSGNSTFYGSNITGTEISTGATLDTNGFQTNVKNLDLDGGTIRSSNGALLLTVSDTTTSVNSQAGTIEGTANADVINIDVLNNWTFAGTTFTNWSANDIIDIDGSANANTITGSQFKDVIQGAGGNDMLIGNGGNDNLDGGDGDDLIIINANNGNSQLTGGIGTDTLRLTGGTIAPLTMSGFEAVELQNGATLALSNGQFFGLPGTTAISGTGTISVSLFAGQSALTNTFAVAAGSNITFNITGASGSETIIIHPDAIGIVTDGGGIDTITGGNRGDTFNLSGGTDTVTGGAGNDLFALSSGANGSFLNGGADTDTLRVISGSVNLGSVTGFEAIDLTAGTTLNLTNAQFTNGFAPSSALSGTGQINVTMAVGDMFFATGFTGGANVNFNVVGSSGIDVIKSVLGASSTIFGNDGIDQIRGGNLIDTIDGGNGNDKIMGLGGADLLTGGTGADQFRYLFTSDSGTGAGADQILDFTAGTDFLDFRTLDANPNIAGRQALTYVGTSSFSATGQAEVRWSDLGADLRVYVDLDGNGTSDMEMLLVGAGTQTLASTDFLF